MMCHDHDYLKNKSNIHLLGSLNMHTVRARGIPIPLGFEPQPNNVAHTVLKPRSHTTLKPIWTNDLR